MIDEANKYTCVGLLLKYPQKRNVNFKWYGGKMNTPYPELNTGNLFLLQTNWCMWPIFFN